MRLGLNLGYWGAGNDAANLELAKEADRLGYAVAWAAEAYGSDAPTVLTWVAAHTKRMDVSSALRRERVSYAGRHFALPLPDGPGKPLKLIVHPVRDEIPIYLASIGPK